MRGIILGIIKYKEFDSIYATTQFYKELDDVLKGFGQRKHFENWLYFKLKMLDMDCKTAIASEPKTFRQIKGHDNLFEIRYRKQKNIRILFSIEDFGKIVLHPFEEKDKNDFKPAIKVAKERKKEYEKNK